MTDFPSDFFRSCIRFRVLYTLFKKKTMFISSLMRDLGVTYSQVWKRISELEKAGLLTRTKRGRVIMLTLTDDGEKMGKNVDEIITLLDKLRREGRQV